VNAELADLADAIRADPALAARVAAKDGRALAAPGALDAHPAFAARLARFLEDHGHRETDPDPYQPTWGEAPWVVLEQLRVLAAQPRGEDPLARELAARADQAAAERQLLARAPADLHAFLGELCRLARTYAALDDLEHYQSTRLHRLFRAAVLDMGRALARRGLLAADDDLFFVRRTALEAAVAAATPAAWGEVARAAAAGRAAYLAARRTTPRWVLDDADAAPAAGAGAGAGALTGLPGAPGVAEGPVFRVRSTDDFSRFPRGAVLVARTTNPAWTPLFYAAAAVVTESGGPLSHGAVTARELGLPAVMAVRGCMDVPDGTRVRVVGATGVVERVAA
jgi:pyruvate,water dikinase